MKIRFMYQGDDYSLAREIIITKLSEAVSTIIDLPDEIEIRLAYLGESVYGNTNVGNRFKNRISLNRNLTVKEIPEILVHELLHIHQVHIGKLRTTNNGQYYWNNIQYIVPKPEELDYAAHQKLPWEQDVAEKQQQILKKALLYAIQHS